jgi:predicted nucleotidyltransferase
MANGVILTLKWIAALKQAFLPFAEKIESVGLFGSHALGTARPNSDIDLVVYGTLAQRDLDRIWTMLDDGPLPVKVDVVAYNLALYPPLRAHIDRNMVALFTQADLVNVNAA